MNICRKQFNIGASIERISDRAALKRLGSSRLILVGTLHLDIALGSIIRSFLDTIEPELVCVEISPFSVEFRKRHQAGWIAGLEKVLETFPPAAKTHAAVQLLRFQLIMPYEWTSSSSYAQEKGIECIPVDDSHIARKELPTWESELITRQNIMGLAGTKRFCLVRYLLEKHEEAWHYLGTGQGPSLEKDLFRWLSEPVWQNRERGLASRLSRLVNSCPGPVVHVGGWMHLKSDGDRWKTLAHMLERLKPSRVLVSRDKKGTPLIRILD